MRRYEAQRMNIREYCEQDILDQISRMSEDTENTG